MSRCPGMIYPRHRPLLEQLEKVTRDTGPAGWSALCQGRCVRCEPEQRWDLLVLIRAVSCRVGRIVSRRPSLLHVA